MNEKVYEYLGYYGVNRSRETDGVIASCREELERIAQFRFYYRAYETPPEFLLKEPYLEFLRGSRGVVLAVTTLGAETDRKIRYYARTDAARSVVLDAVASAYLERRADEYEKTLGDLSYRFCPGYGGSSVTDVREIFALLSPEKIGVTLTETNYMLPSKSMAGVYGVGTEREKSCGKCVLLPHCKLRGEGKRCYGSEKKY